MADRNLPRTTLTKRGLRLRQVLVRAPDTIDMARKRQAGYVLIVLGLLLFSLTFAFSGGTARACPEIDSVVYDTVGVHPAEFGVTGVDLSDFEVGWYDGCNWHRGPLLFPILGVVTSIAGLAIFIAPMRRLLTDANN
jgi:hypothetical protein